MQSELSTFARDDSYVKTMNDKDTETQRKTIRNLLMSHPEGLTDTEICIHTGICKSSVNGRRNEIKDVVIVGLAKVINWDGGEDRLNTMWSVK